MKTEVPAEILVADLEELIPIWMESLVIPGLSIALVKDAELFWVQGFGVKCALSEKVVTTDTVFSAQSLSKPGFAYAALRMCQTGLLDLDTPLAECLPEPYMPDEPRLKLITMRHVLTHTAGFPNWRPNGQSLRMIFDPGERFSYSGQGYVYLQRVIEHLSGQSLAQYMESNLLTPLGMHASFYAGSRDDIGRAAEAHDEMGRPFKQSFRFNNAAGSLFSTPIEFATFLIEIMQPARENLLHLSEMLRSEMQKPQIRIDASVSWGLGWGIMHGAGDVFFWQHGKSRGIQAFAIGCKELGFGAVIMTNSGNGLKICREIVARSIGAHLWPDQIV